VDQVHGGSIQYHEVDTAARRGAKIIGEVELKPVERAGRVVLEQDCDVRVTIGSCIPPCPASEEVSAD